MPHRPRHDPPSRRAVLRGVLRLPAGLLLGGVVLGQVLLLADGLAPPVLGRAVAFDPAAARTILATGAGGVLSIAAFTFWMRMVAVQLVTSTFSPRLLASFLEDRFQQVVMAAMIGAFGLVVTVLRGVPAEGTPADVPQLAVVAGVLVVAAAAAGILVSIRVSVHALDSGRLVAGIAARVRRVIEEVYPGDGEQHAVDPTPPREPGHPVHGPGTGWTTGIDDAGLLEVLPAGAVVRFDARIGSFVVADEVVATVWVGDDGDAADACAHVRAALEVRDTRDPFEDLEYGLRQLVDVGEQSLTSSAPDSGTAHEVIGHLGGVLDVLVAAEAPPPAHGDHAGRRIIRDRELDQASLLRGAIAPLRQSGARFPHVAKDLLLMLAGLRDRARERGRDVHVAAVHREAALVVEGCRATPAVLEADAEEVAELAHRVGLPDSLDAVEEGAPSIPAVT